MNIFSIQPFVYLMVYLYIVFQSLVCFIYEHTTVTEAMH